MTDYSSSTAADMDSWDVYRAGFTDAWPRLLPLCVKWQRVSVGLLHWWTLLTETFTEQISPMPDHDYFHFVSSDNRSVLVCYIDDFFSLTLLQEFITDMRHTEGLETSSRPTASHLASDRRVWPCTSQHWSSNRLSPSAESTGMEQTRRNGNVRLWTSHMMMMMVVFI